MRRINLTSLILTQYTVILHNDANVNTSNVQGKNEKGYLLSGRIDLTIGFSQTIRSRKGGVEANDKPLKFSFQLADGVDQRRIGNMSP